MLMPKQSLVRDNRLYLVSAILLDPARSGSEEANTNMASVTLRGK